MPKTIHRPNKDFITIPQSGKAEQAAIACRTAHGLRVKLTHSKQKGPMKNIALNGLTASLCKMPNASTHEKKFNQGTRGNALISAGVILKGRLTVRIIISILLLSCVPNCFGANRPVIKTESADLGEIRVCYKTAGSGVLIVKTDHDFFIPVAIFDRMAKLIKNSKVLYLPEGTHSVCHQKPEAVSTAIRAFIRAIDNAKSS